MIVKKKRRVGKKSVKFQVKIIKNNMDNKVRNTAKSLNIKIRAFFNELLILKYNFKI